VQTADAVVIGGGPNGLSAGIELARAGKSVILLERAPTIGGGARTAPLTLPGFVHDVCSAVHPLAASSPFFQGLPLARHGLEWIEPRYALAHPFDDGTAAILERSLAATAARLGVDAGGYRSLIGPLADRWTALVGDVFAPLHWPAAFTATARFGWHALGSARSLAERRFSTGAARGLFAGLAAHAMLLLEQPLSAAAGLVLAAAAHAVGWPFARGGSQHIADALGAHFIELGGSIETGREIRSLNEVPAARAVLCDVTPRQLVRMAGDRLGRRFQRRLSAYRYGMGAFKIDWALSAPIPWTAAACTDAGTVHVGGTLDEIAASERAACEGRAIERPFVLVAQPTTVDAGRAPAGRHVAWGYCHVPHGSAFDMTDRIEQQIERFAPGFGNLILARSVRGPAALERDNPNLIGGDINGGVLDLRQLFMRPTWRAYATPHRDLYLCSASTPPGGGVHGLCGFFAARAALSRAY
jgi:phytoene dehydrogenase-like protein